MHFELAHLPLFTYIKKFNSRTGLETRNRMPVVRQGNNTRIRDDANQGHKLLQEASRGEDSESESSSELSNDLHQMSGATDEAALSSISCFSGDRL